MVPETLSGDMKICRQKAEPVIVNIGSTVTSCNLVPPDAQHPQRNSDQTAGPASGARQPELIQAGLTTAALSIVPVFSRLAFHPFCQPPFLPWC